MMKHFKVNFHQMSRLQKGLAEALQLVREGATWKLFIPPDLAHGAQGTGTKIGPNELTIIEVELLRIKTVEE